MKYFTLPHHLTSKVDELGYLPSDVVWIPAGVKHWHGASADTSLTHIAIQEALDGKVVDWLEHVSDERYPGSAAAR